MLPRQPILALALILGALVVPPLALSQEEPAPADVPESAPEPAPLAIPEIGAEAETTASELRRIDGQLQPDQRVGAIAEQLEAAEASIQQRAAQLEGRIEAGLSLVALRDAQRIWSSLGDQRARWQAALTTSAQRLEQHLDDLAGLTERWERARAVALEKDAPDAVLERIAQTLRSIDDVAERVKPFRTEALTLQGKVSEQQSVIAEALQRLTAERQAARSGLLAPERAPIWALEISEPETPFGEQLAMTMERHLERVVDFVRVRTGRLVAAGLLALLVFVALLALRTRTESLASSEPEIEPTAQIFRYPVSATAILFLAATPIVFPRAPSALNDLIVFALLVPLLRLLPRLLGPSARGVVYAVAAFYFAEKVRDLVEPIAVVDRLMLAAIAFVGVIFIGRLARREVVSQLRPDGRWVEPVTFGLRVALALLSASLLANVLGYVALADLLVEGTLASASLALVLFGGVRVAYGILLAALRTRAASRIGAIRNHRDLLAGRARGVLRLGALACWVYVSLFEFQVWNPVSAAFATALTAPLEAGTVSISLRDVVAFGLAIAAAFYLSRFIRFLLDEDIYPRLAIASGTAHAMSSTLHYVLLSVGFVIALGAAGIDLGRFTLLAGAFGVGLGFGLQTVVNNFVSGLILLFERPIKVGDTVQVGDLFGEVKRIGVRSSTIRTWAGSEVIVPNANLIAEEVTNWTLSDRQRRLEIPLGVSYGSEPEQVRTLMLEVAREHDDVLDYPEPQALFQDFGDSSLDFELRVWIGDFDRFVVVKSEIRLALHEKLREKGIEIPFPQRDLHIKSSPTESRPGPGTERAS